jgi:ubiquinone/menaquinone biosynthesis C-methylase UbiE
MVERTRRRLAGRAGTRVSLGHAARIEASDGSFDAVFDFGAIHQMPDWPAAVAEVRRVLKPGARRGDGEPVQYAVDLGPLPLVVLDTTRPGEDPGTLDTERLARLDAELAASPEAPTLLAMHHPPPLHRGPGLG